MFHARYLLMSFLAISLCFQAVPDSAIGDHKGNSSSQKTRYAYDPAEPQMGECTRCWNRTVPTNHPGSACVMAQNLCQAKCGLDFNRSRLETCCSTAVQRPADRNGVVEATNTDQICNAVLKLKPGQEKFIRIDRDAEPGAHDIVCCWFSTWTQWANYMWTEQSTCKRLEDRGAGASSAVSRWYVTKDENCEKPSLNLTYGQMPMRGTPKPNSTLVDGWGEKAGLGKPIR